MCTFELSLCGWYNDDTAPLTWRRYKGATPTVGTGPEEDWRGGKLHLNIFF